MRFSKIWGDDVGCVNLISGGVYGVIINSCGFLKSGILLDLMNDNKVIKKDCYQVPSLHLLD